MAKFRMVHTEFWDDPKVVEEMTPEDKFFFLYLLTNKNTTQVGIYQITKKQIAFDMGYSLETITSLLDRFTKKHKLVTYNPETREIAIKNWGKYNLIRGGKPMLDCVRSELTQVKDKSLIPYVGEQVQHQEIKKLYVTCDDTLSDTQTTSAQYKEKDKEKDKEEDKDNKYIRDLFDHYLSKNIIRHQKLTESMRRAIKARLKDYSFEELKKAIDNYAHVFHSDVHWFTHKYPLADFMRDKDIRKFLDEADPLNNYMRRTFKKEPKAMGQNYDPSRDRF